MFKDLSIAATVTIVAIIVVSIAGITSMFIFESARPTLLDMRREGNQRSQQYVETTRGRLFDLKRNYDDLQGDIDRLGSDESNATTVRGMIARQESLLDEMEEEANSIPRDEVPEKIKVLLINERGF